MSTRSSGEAAWPNRWLLAAAAASAAAALAHLACIAIGPKPYLLLGAGPGMAAAAARGDARAALLTAAIALILLGWAAYALSAAGLIRRLPLRRTALVAICAVLLLRGLVPLLAPGLLPPNTNSATFWLVSSLLCTGMGLLFLVGTVQTWSVKR